jgi:hypothetical protein
MSLLMLINMTGLRINPFTVTFQISESACRMSHKSLSDWLTVRSKNFTRLRYGTYLIGAAYFDIIWLLLNYYCEVFVNI